MLKTLIEIIRNYKRALKKHPTFPSVVASPHTTYRSLRMCKEYFQRVNDEKKESISSVLNEETSELMCELFKKRWRRAEKEWIDVISVMIRIYLVIKREKKRKYNEIVSYRRFKRMLRTKTLVQGELFGNECNDKCPHKIVNGSVTVCSVGNCKEINDGKEM